MEGVAAVIVAAGRGERAGTVGGPKQYRMLGGVAVIRRAVDGLAAVERLVVVIHPDDRALLDHALLDLRRDVLVVTGGATRQASVLNGLRALSLLQPEIVLIHDAARPFVDVALIERVVSRVRQTGQGTIPALAVADTLKRAAQDKTIAETVERSGLFAAQTPQGFPFRDILKAHEQAADAAYNAFTDDAAIAEWAGLPVHLVDGSPDNTKITLVRDIEAAEERLRGRAMGTADIRTGNGYDVHRLVPGDGVTLCGVRIPHDAALSGHSDADVGLHALTDALLGTCGEGDIGDHFPPSDPRWKGASSDRFLRHAADLVERRGGRITNVDVSLICEAPKIGPHRMAMREAIGRILSLPLDRVSVKATTNETIGFVGRKEGIAAIATATVAYGETR